MRCGGSCLRQLLECLFHFPRIAAQDINYDVALCHLVPRISFLQLRSKWCVLGCLLLCFDFPVLDPRAAHLNYRQFPLALVYNGGINSVHRKPQFLSACRGTSQYAVARSFLIHRLGVDCGVPRFLSVYQIKRSEYLEEQDFQYVVVAFQVLSLRKRRATCQDVLHALWSFAAQSTPLVSSRGRSRFPAVKYPSGNNCWYSSCAPTIECVGAVFQWWSQASIPPPLGYHPPICSSSASLATSPPQLYLVILADVPW